MQIIVCKKSYSKETKEIQKAIVNAINTLYERIQAYESQGIDFDHIFNNDKIKYDKHGQFYTYKCKRANTQIRILYAYITYKDESTFVIADYYIKKRDNKEYIKQFDSANKCNPYKLLNNHQYQLQSVFCV